MHVVLRPGPLGLLLGGAPPSKIQHLWVFGGQIWQCPRPKCLDMFSFPGLPLTMTGKPKAEAQFLAPRRHNAGQAHPPELPAGQAELAPDLKPHPCLSYFFCCLLVAAGRTSLTKDLLALESYLRVCFQDRIGGTEWLSNWTPATQLREEGEPEVVSLESGSRTCTPTHQAALSPQEDRIHSLTVLL